MNIIILIIGLLILAAGITLYCLSSGNTMLGCWAYRHDELYCTLNVVGVVITIASIIAILANIYTCSTETAINQKIEIYQQENQYIETVVAEAVKNYQEYEKQAFTSLKPNEIIVAISLYPELKSNELVAKQLEIYTSNNQEIKKLKAEKANISTSKWWLYFGR
jgi:hypothetical protein